MSTTFYTQLLLEGWDRHPLPRSDTNVPINYPVGVGERVSITRVWEQGRVPCPHQRLYHTPPLSH